jgi:hypothetical protein
MATISLSDIASTDITPDGAEGMSELLATNWQTTAAIGLTVATGGVLGAISLVAFPAQTIAAGTGIGVLAYAGNRRANGETPLPFLDKLAQKDAETTPTPTKVEETTTSKTATAAA